ncbi:Sodium/potassium/calcium exchanger 6, mitochondrial [Sciurus carolinensis]|uniref:Sodium/potassium/calcium exchanger 6, mitochondrial n=1 Tax=Sciurus carolinensis TaxID=30640 RepID=A0AA41SPS7_SCICA|nr:Sodium/potassium/calcium exchanger 6, mitochondrial [Sciurus carolinensis]
MPGLAAGAQYVLIVELDKGNRRRAGVFFRSRSLPGGGTPTPPGVVQEDTRGTGRAGKPHLLVNRLLESLPFGTDLLQKRKWRGLRRCGVDGQQMAGAHGVLRRLSVLLMVETVSGAWGPSTGTHTSPPFPGSAVNQTPVADCHRVSGLNASERCDFVRTNPDCRSPGGYLDYLDGLFCRFPPGLLPLAVTLYASWLLYLFLILGVTASKFCPTTWQYPWLRLRTPGGRDGRREAGRRPQERPAWTLTLSYGVTFLAFGNGAPDIFSALVAFSDPRTAGLAIGALFGAGVLVTTVVAGGIAVLHPFLAASRPFLRDIAFYMVAVFLTFTALYLGRVTLAWALGYLGLYLFYVVTVVLCTWIYRWQRRKSLVCSLPGTPELLSDSEEDPVSSGTNSCDFGDEFRPLLDQEESTARALARALNPLDCRTWRSKPASWRALKLFKLPVEFLLLLTVPVVDPDKEDRNWKRPLNCLQLAVSPLVLTLTLQSGASGDRTRVRAAGLHHRAHRPSLAFTGRSAAASLVPTMDASFVKTIYRGGSHILCQQEIGLVSGEFMVLQKQRQWTEAPDGAYQIGGLVPVWAVVVIAGTATASVTFFATTNGRPPRLHWLFAFLGFLTSALWINVAATEVVNILRSLGVVFRLSNTVLGLTLLAWGNSIGDAFADFTLARQGYPRMAFSACFGGIIFSILQGLCWAGAGWEP